MTKIMKSVFIIAPVEMYIFWLSYFALGWGVLLLTNSEQLFALNYYRIHSLLLMPQEWFYVYAGVAMFGMYSCINGKKLTMTVASMMLFLLWLFTSVSLIMASQTITTGIFIYCTFIIVAGWSFLRIGNKSFKGLWTF